MRDIQQRSIGINVSLHARVPVTDVCGRPLEAGSDEQGGCAQYTAVPQAVGAPLRTVTVRDAIGDLPPITNGACQVELPYSGAPRFSHVLTLLPH